MNPVRDSGRHKKGMNPVRNRDRYWNSNTGTVQTNYQ